VATEYHLPIQTDSRLTEAGNKFEGTTIGAHPWQLLKPKNLKLLRNPFRPSWGEPFQEQAARMAAVVAELREEYAGHEVVVVSHQSPIWMLRRHLEGKALWGDPRRRQCSVCSVTILDYDAGADTPVISYEEPVAHLSQTLSAEGWSAK
jgi:broad specificity phosphatase PhoE